MMYKMLLLLPMPLSQCPSGPKLPGFLSSWPIAYLVCELIYIVHSRYFYTFIFSEHTRVFQPAHWHFWFTIIILNNLKSFTFFSLFATAAKTVYHWWKWGKNWLCQKATKGFKNGKERQRRKRNINISSHYISTIAKEDTFYRYFQLVTETWAANSLERTETVQMSPIGPPSSIGRHSEVFKC